MTTPPPNPYYAPPNPALAPGHHQSVRRSPSLIVAAVLAVLGAICAVSSMFLTYVSFRSMDDGKIEFEQSVTPWAFKFNTADSEVSPGLAESIPPLYGVLLALLALGLLLTAVLTIRASSAAGGSGRTTAARATALATASAALCLSLMLLLDVISFLSFEHNQPDDSLTESYRIEAGFWVIMGVGLFAVAAVVSAALRPRRAPATQWPQVQQYPGQSPAQQYQQPYPQQQQYPYPQQASQPHQQGTPGYY